MEDEFYNLVVKGNDLKTYIRRFQELAFLCPNMVQNSEKLMEVFIGGLPRSIEGNVTSSKPQTLEEAITITQRLMEQVIKHNSAQETNDHKRKFEGGRNITENNNYPMITTTITTPPIVTRTTIKITTTITTVTMLTTNSKIEGKKLSELMLPPQLRTKGVLKSTIEIFLYVQDAPCITHEFALSSVRLATT
nr:reverse transcriptase domain-containing protein [Tanacetum cinerariifolium]